MHAGSFSTWSNKTADLIRWQRANPWFSVFLVLVVMKFILLGFGREQLVQEQLRIQPERVHVGRHLVLSALITLSVLIPAWRWPAGKLAATNRGLLMGFLVLTGLLMTQLINRNYIQTAISGVISVADVGDYLISDIFFKAPYLILHIAAMGVGWFVGKRLGDDRIFVSVFAGSAGILCLRQLIAYDAHLFANDLWCLALFLFLGCIELLLRPNVPTRRYAFFTVLFGNAAGLVLYAHAVPCNSIVFHSAFLVFGLCFSGLIGRAVLKNNKSCGFLYLFWGYAFYTLINSGYPLSSNMSNIYRLSIFVGRYFADDLILILLMFLLLHKWPWSGIILFGLFSTVYLATAYVDLNYFLESGRRLSGFMLEMGGGTGMAVKMVSGYLTPSFFLLFLAAAVLALAGPFFTWRNQAQTVEDGAVSWKGLLFAVGLAVTGGLWCKSDSFAGSFVRNAVSDSAFVKKLRSPKIPQDQLLAGFRDVGISLSPAFSGGQATEGGRKNLVLVILESMPNKYLSLFSCEDETLPRLGKYSDRMVLFPNIFCTWPSSNHARTTIWSGLYPIRPFTSLVNPRISSISLTEILEDAGYLNAFFYSSDKNYTRLNDYLGHRGIHWVDDAKAMGEGLEKEQLVSWGVRESVTLEHMKRFIEERCDDPQPFSMMYIPACPHMPFDTHDDRFVRFDEGHGRVDRNYTGSYKNQILYMDWILASLVESLDGAGLLENTCIVLINDHGELVNAADGGLGHGWSTDPVMANIPLIIMPPALTHGAVNTSIGSQVDVLPTILDYLDISVSDKQWLQGDSLKGLERRDRRIYLGSYRDYAVVDGELYYWFRDGEHASGICMSITNTNGTETVFTPLDIRPSVDDWRRLERDYGRFRELQESLIRHYDEYDHELF